LGKSSEFSHSSSFSPCGGALAAWITARFAPEARGHGVPEVMVAVALHGGVIRPRVIGVKALASATSIGFGGSSGREGPIVQIGSAIGSVLGQLSHAPAPIVRTLVACGAAAGIFATFNAPIGGVFFASEVILGDFCPAFVRDDRGFERPCCGRVPRVSRQSPVV
jgi:CIC family chloride channel protein